MARPVTQSQAEVAGSAVLPTCRRPGFQQLNTQAAWALLYPSCQDSCNGEEAPPRHMVWLSAENRLRTPSPNILGGRQRRSAYLLTQEDPELFRSRSCCVSAARIAISAPLSLLPPSPFWPRSLCTGHPGEINAERSRPQIGAQSVGVGGGAPHSSSAHTRLLRGLPTAGSRKMDGLGGLWEKGV